MRTTKPISTISYNTPAFLQQKLFELQKAHIVEFWCFIRHKPEDDECNNKPHIHLYIEPGKKIDTMTLKDEFKEFLGAGVKPLGCLSFCSSKFNDWYLYSIHDKAYLALKNQSRKFHYTHHEVIADEDELNFRVKQIDMSSINQYAPIVEAVELGLSFEQYVMRGSVPIPQIKQFQTAFELIRAQKTSRNDRKTHSPSIDADSGEVLDAEEI